MQTDRVTAALTDILTSLDVTIRRLVRGAPQGDPDTASELKYFRAQRDAYTRALYHHLRGVTAEAVEGAWMLASATRPGVVHRVTVADGIHLCSCEAGTNGRACWHTRLIEGYEAAAEQADAHDDGLPAYLGDDAAYAAMLAAA